VDLVKIEVEGAEGDVLLGMARCLAMMPPKFVICAMDHPSEAARQGAYQFLRSAGYREVRFDTLEALTGSVATRGNKLFVRYQ
jgi:hypothetical protein